MPHHPLPRSTRLLPALPRPGLALSGVLCLALGACAGPRLPTAPPGDGRLTVQGDFEVIARCIAEVSDKSTAGAATVSVDRAARKATVRRVKQPSNETQYELGFRQSGATTVTVEGRALANTPEATGAFAFLWSHVEICARDRMAP